MTPGLPASRGIHGRRRKAKGKRRRAKGKGKGTKEPRTVASCGLADSSEVAARQQRNRPKQGGGDLCSGGCLASPPRIDERAAKFLADVIAYSGTIVPVPGTRRVIEQLVSAAGSVAANRQEACGASTKREFIRYNEIALRSANESVVWLNACRAGKWGRPSERERLLDEAGQLARILAAIIISAKRSRLGSSVSRGMAKDLVGGIILSPPIAGHRCALVSDRAIRKAMSRATRRGDCGI